MSQTKTLNYMQTNGKALTRVLFDEFESNSWRWIVNDFKAFQDLFHKSMTD